ncbi:unnamed protein product, partial [Heterotrigona itama]
FARVLHVPSRTRQRGNFHISRNILAIVLDCSPVENRCESCSHVRARNKPADGVGHVNQKGSTGQKAPLTAGQKVAPGAKGAAKPAQKPSAQKGQVKVTPKAASVKTGKNKKKGQRQQYDLIVTINLV